MGYLHYTTFQIWRWAVARNGFLVLIMNRSSSWATIINSGSNAVLAGYPSH